MTNLKNDTDYHETLKQASTYVYHGINAKLPQGYRVIDKAENKKNGFYAEALSNGKNIIIVYRGTDRLIGNDGRNDFAMARKNIPAQASDALAFHDKVKREHKNIDITVTGHSLGGSLVQIVSGIRGTFAVAFNAYGVRDMFKAGTKLKENNIVNYVNELDIVTMPNAHNNIGDIYAIKNMTQNSLNPHNCEAMGSLKEREYRTIEDIKNHQNILYRVINKTKYVGNKAVSSVKGTMHNATQCVGSYPVCGYTRSDGTRVGDYIRTCGAKHKN